MRIVGRNKQVKLLRRQEENFPKTRGKKVTATTPLNRRKRLKTSAHRGPAKKGKTTGSKKTRGDRGNGPDYWD